MAITHLPKHFSNEGQRLIHCSGTKQTTVAERLRVSKAVVCTWFGGTAKPGAANRATLHSWLLIDARAWDEPSGVKQGLLKNEPTPKEQPVPTPAPQVEAQPENPYKVSPLTLFGFSVGALQPGPEARADMEKALGIPAGDWDIPPADDASGSQPKALDEKTLFEAFELRQQITKEAQGFSQGLIQTLPTTSAPSVAGLTLIELENIMTELEQVTKGTCSGKSIEELTPEDLTRFMVNELESCQAFVCSSFLADLATGYALA